MQQWRRRCVCGGRWFHHFNDPDGCWCPTCLGGKSDERCRAFREKSDVEIVPDLVDMRSTRRELFELARGAGERGLTDGEMAEAVGRSRASVSRVRLELVRSGALLDSRRRRDSSIVWVARTEV